MFNFLFKKPVEEVPAASAELPKRVENDISTTAYLSNSFLFPTKVTFNKNQRTEENESDFHGAACYSFRNTLRTTVILSRDFDNRLVIVAKKEIAAYERVLIDSNENELTFRRLFNFRDDDFEGAGRYLLGASYAIGRDNRAEISHTIPYNPKSTQLADGWCDAYAVLLREHDRIALKISHTAALFNKAMEVLNEAAQSYQQLVQMDAKLNEKMTAIAKKIGKL